MSVDVDLRPDLDDLALLVDQETWNGGRPGVSCRTSSSRRSRRTRRRAPIGIRQQLERNRVLRLELLMRLDRVAADADDPRVLLLKLLVDVAELRGLAGAARRIVFWIKIQDECPPSKSLVLTFSPLSSTSVTSGSLSPTLSNAMSFYSPNVSLLSYLSPN